MTSAFRSLKVKMLLPLGIITFLILASTTYLHINDLRHSYREVVLARSEMLSKDIYASIVKLCKTSENIEWILRIQAIACNDLWKRHQKEGFEHFSIINRRNIYVAHNDAAQIGQPVNPELTEALKTGVNKIVSSEGTYHTLIPIVYQKQLLGNIDVGVSANQLNTRIRQVLYTKMLVFLFIFALAIAMFTIWAKAIFIKPITQLTQNSIEIASGNLNVNIGINRNDEIGALAQNFSHMKEAIKEKITDLKNEIDQRQRIEKEISKLNAELEERVVSRTEQLAAEKQKAEAANNAKSDFLANMSHEIRTPMNAVLGFTEILRAKEQDPKKAHYIDNIHTSGHALLNLINDILDLSKIEAGKLELQYSSVSMKSLLEEMETVFDRKITDKGLNFLVKCDDHIPFSLILDETRLRQIIINLIGNAIKFTENGYIRLLASANKTSAHTRSQVDLFIEVEDTGIGIPKDQQDRIFGAFEQTKGQKTEKYGGTGLGLAITSRLVEMMGGTLTVESEEDKGTTFRITLSGVEVGATLAESADKERQLDFTSISFDPQSILIVDDIDYNREMLSTYLQDWDFTIILAENGKAAIDQARQHKPDLILLDMKMPVMDGYEASRILNDDPALKDIPVIAVTSSALKQDEAIIAQLCDGYLRKPISKSDLIREVMKFLPHTQTK